MNDLASVAQAIRRVESGDDYRKQQQVAVRGQADRKVGAYGILQSRWDGLVAELGYGGGKWQDPAMQDRLAAEVLKRAYQQLDDWTLAAIAFRFGMPAARHLKEKGITTAKDLESVGLKAMGNYVRALESNSTKNLEMSVDGRPVDMKKPVRQSPTRKRGEDIIRGMLYEMRNAQRAGRTIGQEEEVTDVEMDDRSGSDIG